MYSFLKAQVTFEYLLISLIVVVLLSLSLVALFHISRSASRNMDILLFDYSAKELHNTMEEMCVMGNGNSRAVYLNKPLQIDFKDSYSVYAIVFTDSQLKLSVSKKSTCALAFLHADLSGKVIVENEKGKIVLR